LLGDVARDAQPLADHERLHHHPGWVGRAADVAHFPRAHQIIQRPQRFILRDFQRWAVDLIQVNVVSSESAQ
jgi:hypothetical protein